MKTHKYKGPEGSIEFRDPLALRMVESNWFMAACALVFMVWGGYYLSFTNPEALYGRGLTPGHLALKNDCFTCHVPFRGVPNNSCVQSGCHAAIHAHQSHYRWACVECHDRHTDGAFDPRPYPDAECVRCHEKEESDPTSPFHPDNKTRRKSTTAPMSILPHGKHETSRYKCVQCHCLGRNTLQTQMEDLFKMETCMLCKEHVYKPPKCKVCHNHGQPRRLFHLERAITKRRDCMTPDELMELVHKVKLCTPYLSREPGFKNLTVCETDENIVEWLKGK